MWPNSTDLMQNRARQNGQAKYGKSGPPSKRQKKSANAVRPKRALLCLTLGNPIRSAAINLVEWKYPLNNSICAVSGIFLVRFCGTCGTLLAVVYGRSGFFFVEIMKACRVSVASFEALHVHY